jgi:two-component system capsular synthesis sensor histidine kinase RcsC
MVTSEQNWDFSVGTSQLINLRETLQRWSAAVTPLAESRSLKLSVSCDTALPDRIYSELEALNYIVAELMINAVRYAVTDQINLSLQKRSSSFAIVVRDTGIGLPSKSAAKQGATAVGSRAPEIKALASPSLATVRRLTQLLGGSVMIFSQSNGGTTLTVLLPLVTASDAPTQPLRP